MRKNQLEIPAWQRALRFGVRFICVVVVLAFIAEGAVRARHWTRQGVFWGTDQTYTIDPGSNLRIPIPNGTFGPVHINSFGFRSPEIPLEKPAGRLRLAFLGGSTTYCAEVSSDQMTWPYLVVAAIKKRFPDLDIDFINGGIPGYTTGTLKPYLERRIARFHPDVIFIYEASNDLTVNSSDLAQEQGVTNKKRCGIGGLALPPLPACLSCREEFGSLETAVSVVRKRQGCDGSGETRRHVPQGPYSPCGSE